MDGDVAPHDWERTRAAFVEATRWYQEVLAQVGDRWSEPGLGEWDVRALAGHTSRSLLTVETYLGQPADAVDIASTVPITPQRGRSPQAPPSPSADATPARRSAFTLL